MTGGRFPYPQHGGKADAAPRRQSLSRQFRENPAIARIPSGVQNGQAHIAMVGHIQVARGKLQVVIQGNQHFGTMAADDAAQIPAQRQPVLDDPVRIV